MAAAAGGTTPGDWWQTHHSEVVGTLRVPTPASPVSSESVVDTAKLIPSPSASTSASAAAAASAAAEVSNPTAHFHAWAKRDKYLLLHKCIYYVGMGAAGSYFPWITRHWRTIGVEGFRAGIILSSSHVVALFCAPSLTRLADSSERWRRVVLLGGALTSAVLFFSMRLAKSFWAALVLQMVGEGVGCVVWPIVDASLLACLQAVDGSTANYGNTRAWAAAGWGINAAIAGAIFDRWGLDKMFLTYAAMSLPLFPLLTLLPLERRAATHESTKNAWRRLATVDVGIFLGVVIIIAALLFVVDTYRLPYLSDLGADNTLLGLSVTMTSVSEVPCFFIVSAVLKRVRMPTVLLTVLLCYVLRYVWYANLTDPAWTMPMELLHGAQYAFGWAAMVSYAASLLPPELSSSAQGLLSASSNGVGGAFGSLAGGYIFEHLGGRALMRYCAGLAGMGVCVMLLSMWRTRRLERGGASPAGRVGKGGDGTPAPDTPGLP